MTSFKQMQKDGTIKRADARLVRLADIHEEPGFNLRDENATDANGETFQQSIERLADYIAQGGQYPALEVRPRNEGGVWLVDGHRRARALQLCVERGVPLADANGDVWVAIVPFEGNNADRTARIITSREGRALSPLEVSEGYKRLAAFGWDAARIAKTVGKTPQHVTQLLTLANANSDVHQIVAAGGVSAAVAVDMVRKHGENAGKVLADEVGKARAQGKTKATAGTIKGPKVPHKVLDALAGQVDAFIGQLPQQAHLRLASIAKAMEGGQLPDGQEVSVPVSALLSLLNAHGEFTSERERQEQKARERANKAAQVDIEQAAA
jgi:ParB-like chromosome segregation protein Spo0J